MKAVMLSIRPQWCELICNGKKTVEVRKSRPKIPKLFKCYIYCTQDKEHTLFKDWIDPPFVTKEYNIMNGKGIKNVFADNRPWGNANGKVIGEFVCDNISKVVIDFDRPSEEMAWMARKSRIPIDSFCQYAGDAFALYGWHISALQIYDKPKGLSEFTKFGYDTQMPCCRMSRPPQSWGYVEELT